MEEIKKAVRQEFKERLEQMQEKIKTHEDLNYNVRWILNKRDSFKGSFEEQKEKFFNSYKKRLDKELDKTLKHIEAAENSEDFNTQLVITIEWKSSYMWRSNPRAYTNFGFKGSSIGGCGYDKKSTAAAEALNSHLPLLKMLYEKKERELKKFMEENKDKDNKNGFNREVLGYGSGYNIIPRFEGGVGVDSHRRIIENLGLKWQYAVNTDNTDVFIISKGVRK